MADVLDRSRPFGKVVPVYHGAAHEQDGRHYDVHGDRVFLPGEKKSGEEGAAAPASRASWKTKAAGKAKGARKAKPASKRAEPRPSAPPAAAEPAIAPPKAGEEVNLSAWAIGTADYIMADVSKAIRARFHTQVSNEADAIDVLLKHKVVAPDQVGR